MTAAPARLGLVGCGRLAELGYVPAARLSARARIVAVADPDPVRRRLVADQADPDGPELSDFPDAAALLAGAEVDALVLATPAASHVADATLAVASGVAVLVEKPPAPETESARTLAALGELVHIGFNRRFDPAVAAVRAAVPSTGELELDLAIHYRRASWRAVTVRDEVLLDLAPHLVDLARWLTGSDVRAVSADEVTPDRAGLRLELTRGTATISVAADAVHRERVEVRRAGGALVARHRTGGPAAALTGRLATVSDRLRGRPSTHPLTASLAAQLDVFAGAVRGGAAGALGTGADGVAVMQVVDAARISASRSGATVPLTDLQEQRPC